MRLPIHVRELAEYRELLAILAWRDVRVRYQHSLLGFFWAVAPPLLTMLLFLFVFRQALGVKAPTGGCDLPYPLFALAGLVPWTFFASGLTGAVGSLVNNRALVTKVAFPREVFPLAAILTASFDFLVALLLLAVLVVGGHVLTGWKFQPGPGLLLVPVAFLIQFTLMAGLGFLLALANLHYRDVGFMVRSTLPLLMFLTNVVYPLDGNHRGVHWLHAVNPLVPIIDAYRTALCPANAVSCLPLVYAASTAVVVVAAGWTLFHHLEPDFAERA